MDPTPATVHRWLLELGESPDEVADMLETYAAVGERCDCYRCPVVRYLEERLPDGWKCVVDPCDVVVWRGPGHDGPWFRVAMPPAVGDFVLAFDHGAYDALATPEGVGF